MSGEDRELLQKSIDLENKLLAEIDTIREKRKSLAYKVSHTCEHETIRHKSMPVYEAGGYYKDYLEHYFFCTFCETRVIWKDFMPPSKKAYMIAEEHGYKNYDNGLYYKLSGDLARKL